MSIEVIAVDSIDELNDAISEWKDIVEKFGHVAFAATENSTIGRALASILQPRSRCHQLDIRKVEKYRIKTKFVAKVYFDLYRIE